MTAPDDKDTQREALRASISSYEQAQPRDATEADIGKFIIGLYKCLLKKAEDKQ